MRNWDPDYYEWKHEVFLTTILESVSLESQTQIVSPQLSATTCISSPLSGWLRAEWKIRQQEERENDRQNAGERKANMPSSYKYFFLFQISLGAFALRFVTVCFSWGTRTTQPVVLEQGASRVSWTWISTYGGKRKLYPDIFRCIKLVVLIILAGGNFIAG